MAVLRYCLVTLMSWALFACSTTPAPVIDRTPVSKPGSAQSTANKSNTASKSSAKTSSAKNGSDWRPDTHTVKKGDTLFSIGLEYGYYYKDIARVNNIDAPYVIRIGQTLKLAALKDKSADTAETKAAQEQSDGVVTYPINTDTVSTSSNIATTPSVIAINEPKAIREPYSDAALKTPLPAAKPVAAATPSATKTIEAKPAQEVKETKIETKPETKAETKASTETVGSLSWAWPTKGKVISGFNDGGNKGIDIAGNKGQPIQAAAPGKVIYSGSDLRGYGKLVIVKHNNTYLSVYANNSNILVKEGQQVSAGQKIAEMGDTDSNTVKLHFEIRQQGKSVDPAKFLATN